MSTNKQNSLNWKPLGRCGRSVTTYKLHIVSKDIMRFKPTIQYLIGGLIVSLVGLGLLSFLLFSDNVAYRGPEEAIGYKDGLPLLMAMFFSLIGIHGLWHAITEGASFDLSTKTATIYAYNLLSRKVKKINFIEINCFQLIEKEFYDNMGEGLSYELNLIHNQHYRLTIVEHRDKNIIMKDAEQLSKFLKKELYTNLIGQQYETKPC